jgi:hypothetical protein
MRDHTRDPLGRITLDAVSPGPDVDTFIEAIGTTYDNLGRVEEVISCIDAAATIEANGVRFGYNGLWQITAADEDHLTAVTLDGSGNPIGETKRVTYSYDTKDIAAGNYSRVEAIVYPDGWESDHTYGSTSGSSSKISRLAGMMDPTQGNVSLASYSVFPAGSHTSSVLANCSARTASR